MDYPFILLYILVFVILIFSGIAAFGFDYLESYGTFWTKSPNICLDTTTNPELTHDAFKAIALWKNTMVDYGYSNFGYTMYSVEELTVKSLDHCDVLIRFGPPISIG